MKNIGATIVTLLLSTSIFAQQQWTELTNYPLPGGPIKSLMSTGNHLFVVTPGGNATTAGPNIFQSTDNGASFVKADSNIPTYYGGVAIYYDQPHNTLIYGSDAQYGCYTATDLNNPIWTRINSYIRPSCFAKIDTTLFFSDHISGVFKTLDDCNTWSSLNVPTSPVYSYAIVNKNDTLLASMQFGGTYRSVNKGASWTQVNTGMTNTFVNTYFVKDNYVFAGSYYYGIFRTSDNGDHWTAMNTGLPAVLTGKNFNCFAQLNDSLFVGSDSTGVFLSTDNGNNWMPYNTGIPANTTIFSMVAHNGKLFAGTTGGKIYRLDRNTASITNVNADENPVKVYPNPTSGMIHVHADDWKNVQLDLYSITGVLAFSNTMNSPDAMMDVSSLANGIYILKTSNGPQQKLIIQH